MIIVVVSILFNRRNKGNKMRSQMILTLLLFQDFLEFIDCGCNGFLSTICLVIASYKDLFVEREISK